MKLQKESLRLATVYLAIIMVISLFFSANIYHLSTQELDRGLRRQSQIFGNSHGLNFMPGTIQAIIEEREQEFIEAKKRILSRLIITNIIILAGGGILSYYLARRSIEPITAVLDAQRRFTADASHELRTPIAAMRTEIEVALLNPKFTLKESKKLLESNLEELAKLTNMSESLLHLARLESHSIELKEQYLESIIHEAIAQVIPLAEKKHILIESTIKPNMLVSIDSSSMTKAIITLLDNAVKYSPDNTSVKIAAKTANRQALIQIKDQGEGIAAKDLPHIFDRFYRADAARSKATTGGYGLGLAIAKDIVAAHHGTIEATSKVGKGSLFTIKIPLMKTS